MAVRRAVRHVLFAGALSVAVAGGPAAPTGAAAAPALAPGVGACSWLTSVAALSATNVWAVGGSCTSTSVERTLVLHWNGRGWSIVKSPNVGLYSNTLRQVVALSPTDIWAVGSYDKARTFPSRTLVLHWNGTAWRVVPSPNYGTSDTTSVLSGITAVSSRNLWAVGTWRTRSGTSGGALTMRWNGTQWKLVAAPANPAYEPATIDAVSANDVWATGTRISTVGTVATFSMHWNGRAWGVIPMPNVGVRKNNFLFGGVRAVSAKDVWATGSVNVGTETAPVFRTLVLHWTGVRWSVVPSPSRGNSALYGGTASTSTTDVWAVGSGGGGTSLVEHWNGRSWSIVASPNPGRYGNHLSDVAAVSPTVAFAVGERRNSVGTSQPLVLRWNGRTWTAI